MEKGFLDKVEDNATDFTRISVTHNNLQELKEIWDQWNDEINHLFYREYGDLLYLLDVKMDKYLFRNLASIGIPHIVVSLLER
ncbi:hypothetical protein Godav_024914 [Gossypium davidsonii]|uniref:Uncharacterized protein n=2 Tax=Gossypium TaxID=3633 RepID=A0A7J8TBG5_GOSDV|nr:hypothetical protein [Gossypium davidsonii]MBA0670598.1 hypothetical protein [Gossypium klotzschianum]